MPGQDTSLATLGATVGVDAEFLRSLMTASQEDRSHQIKLLLPDNEPEDAIDERLEPPHPVRVLCAAVPYQRLQL